MPDKRYSDKVRKELPDLHPCPWNTRGAQATRLDQFMENSTAQVAAFLVASTALILVPGPSQALVLATSAAHGARAGVLTALGLNVGTVFHAGLAATGIAALIAGSPALFRFIQLAGAAYLVWLGTRLIRPASATRPTAAEPRAIPRGYFMQGVINGVLNPKVAIFFLAFLPQFANPALGHVGLQLFAFGVFVAVLDSLYESGLAVAFSRVRAIFPSKSDAPRFQRAPGYVFIALGAIAALAALASR